MFDDLNKIVEKTTAAGASFVNARYDDLTLRTAVKDNGRLNNFKTMRRAGAGFHVFYNGAPGYAFTADISMEAMERAAMDALGIAKASAPVTLLKSEIEATSSIKKLEVKPDIKKKPWELETKERLEYLERMEAAAKDNIEKISSLMVLYGELSGKKYFVNSEGSEISWYPSVIDLRTMVATKTPSGDLVSAGDGNGGSAGMELYDFEGKTPEDMGKNAALWAKELIDAKSAPAGEFAALTDNSLSGVLAHESFGHLTEGDFIATKGSPIHDRIGESLGSEHVSMYDEGVMEFSKDVNGFFLPYDDEGMETKKITLLDKGVLKGFLNSRATAPHSDGVVSGNARAINYTFNPIPRMRNTYVSAGELTEDEAIEMMGTGIYALGTSGGQVTGDGTFLFKATRGYFVENGEKKYPIKDVTLTGNILNLLHGIEGATKDFELHSGYFGGCGKGGQFPLPVGLGGPKVLFNKVRFGGEN
ncbi:MAG: TldD/PmbA family protein [Candidatus Heimdallarchaeota archaeon]|nr:TldD/PmbA family protein [Candidatus Heimdallarchaeota archaeon]